MLTILHYDEAQDDWVAVAAAGPNVLHSIQKNIPAPHY